jgi:hypothetical protein
MKSENYKRRTNCLYCNAYTKAMFSHIYSQKYNSVFCNTGCLNKQDNLFLKDENNGNIKENFSS